MAPPAPSAGTPISGSIVALVTPMTPAGELDLDAYRKLIDWHIEQGTDGLVLVGTSGESPTVDVEEHIKLIAVGVEQAAGRVPVIAGVGGNSTAEAIELSRKARAVGADAGLSVVPYYNKPTQEGLFQHFKASAEAVDLPVILYNVPGRCVADLHHETVLRLAEVPGIVGIKDATGDLARGAALINALPSHVRVYSGDDPTAAALILMGGSGNISVTANVAPALMHQLCQAALGGDLARTRELNRRLEALNQALFVQTNPIPVKWAVAELGKIQRGCRLPLVELEAQYHDVVRQAMGTAGLI